MKLKDIKISQFIEIISSCIEKLNDSMNEQSISMEAFGDVSLLHKDINYYVRRDIEEFSEELKKIMDTDIMDESKLNHYKEIVSNNTIAGTHGNMSFIEDLIPNYLGVKCFHIHSYNYEDGEPRFQGVFYHKCNDAINNPPLSECPLEVLKNCKSYHRTGNVYTIWF